MRLAASWCASRCSAPVSRVAGTSRVRPRGGGAAGCAPAGRHWRGRCGAHAAGGWAGSWVGVWVRLQQGQCWWGKGSSAGCMPAMPSPHMRQLQDFVCGSLVQASQHALMPPCCASPACIAAQPARCPSPLVSHSPWRRCRWRSRRSSCRPSAAPSSRGADWEEQRFSAWRRHAGRCHAATSYPRLYSTCEAV